MLGRRELHRLACIYPGTFDETFVFSSMWNFKGLQYSRVENDCSGVPQIRQTALPRYSLIQGVPIRSIVSYCNTETPSYHSPWSCPISVPN